MAEHETAPLASDTDYPKQLREMSYQDLRKRTRALQQMVAALIAGVVAMTGLAILGVYSQGRLLPEGPAVTTWISVATLLGMVLFRFIVVDSVVDGARRKLADSAADSRRLRHDGSAWAELMRTYYHKTLWSVSLIVGPTFLLILAYYVEAEAWALWFIVTAAAVVALHVPTVDGVRRWIMGQFDRIEQEDVPAEQEHEPERVVTP